MTITTLEIRYRVPSIRLVSTNRLHDYNQMCVFRSDIGDVKRK
jgi:hypothetical protein